MRIIDGRFAFVWSCRSLAWLACFGISIWCFCGGFIGFCRFSHGLTRFGWLWLNNKSPVWYVTGACLYDRGPEQVDRRSGDVAPCTSSCRIYRAWQLVAGGLSQRPPGGGRRLITAGLCLEIAARLSGGLLGMRVAHLQLFVKCFFADM